MDGRIDVKGDVVIIGGNSKGQRARCSGPAWYVTRMRFQVDVGRMGAPAGRLGRLRKWLALRLWPGLKEQQLVEGVMEYAPVQGTD